MWNCVSNILARISIVNQTIVQLIFSNCFHGKRPLWELKLVKTGEKHKIFIVNTQERLKKARVKYLIEHEKKKFKYCITKLYSEETLDIHISDTSNELKQILVHNCFYILGKAKTYINFTPI